MELEGYVLTATPDQIRRLIKIIDSDSPYINYDWLEDWLTGYYQSMVFANSDESDATPEMVLDYYESLVGIRKIFT